MPLRSAGFGGYDPPHALLEIGSPVPDEDPVKLLTATPIPKAALLRLSKPSLAHLFHASRLIPASGAGIWREPVERLTPSC